MEKKRIMEKNKLNMIESSEEESDITLINEESEDGSPLPFYKSKLFRRKGKYSFLKHHMKFHKKKLDTLSMPSTSSTSTSTTTSYITTTTPSFSPTKKISSFDNETDVESYYDDDGQSVSSNFTNTTLFNNNEMVKRANSINSYTSNGSIHSTSSTTSSNHTINKNSYSCDGLRDIHEKGDERESDDRLAASSSYIPLKDDDEGDMKKNVEPHHRPSYQSSQETVVISQPSSHRSSLVKIKPRPTPDKNPHDLCTFKECPSWLADNAYILRGYRRPNFSYKLCYKSLAYIHNETVNIYSHLIGAIVFTVLFFFTWKVTIPLLKNISTTEKSLIICSIFGAFACLFLSSTYHTVGPHSETVNKKWLKMDFVGIVLLIITSGLPVAYYSFYCEPLIRTSYIYIIETIGVIALISMFLPALSTDEYRIFRSFIFILLGACELIPVIHSLIIHKPLVILSGISFPLLLVALSLYLLGVYLYSNRIPEKYSPGTFDIWGHSHQLFHILIFIAATMIYVCLINTMIFWNSTENVCSLV